MTEATKRTRAYPSLWIGQIIVEKLDGISGQMTDVVCTKALTESEAIKNFSAYYNHSRRTTKTIVRTVRLYSFSELVQERLCYDLRQMPAVVDMPELSEELKKEADRVSKLTCDQIAKELGVYHASSPDAELPARPMAPDKRPAKSIGSMLEHKEPAAAPAPVRQRTRPAAAPAPAAAPVRKVVGRPVVRRARG